MIQLKVLPTGGLQLTGLGRTLCDPQHLCSCPGGVSTLPVLDAMHIRMNSNVSGAGEKQGWDSVTKGCRVKLRDDAGATLGARFTWHSGSFLWTPTNVQSSLTPLQISLAPIYCCFAFPRALPSSPAPAFERHLLGDAANARASFLPAPELLFIACLALEQAVRSPCEWMLGWGSKTRHQRAEDKCTPSKALAWETASRHFDSLNL